jgi:hypothetical protein
VAENSIRSFLSTSTINALILGQCPPAAPFSFLLAMEGDSSDILGSPNTIVRGDPAGRWLGLSFGIKSTFILALLLVVYAVGIRAWDTLLLWREKSYKLCVSVARQFSRQSDVYLT